MTFKEIKHLFPDSCPAALGSFHRENSCGRLKSQGKVFPATNNSYLDFKDQGDKARDQTKSNDLCEEANQVFVGSEFK